MDVKRASEIVASPDMINVTYNGTPIYIESINYEKEVAYVYPISERNKIQEVSVDSLVEY